MKKRWPAALGQNVFINCPFDDEYLPMLRAASFAIVFCGFRPRCALEVVDAGELRMTKILRLIQDCRLGMHDISRTALDETNQLPRFNMPLELGIFIGASHFGSGLQRKKKTLVVDVERFRYQKFISDIAGQDIKAHHNDPARFVAVIRDWLQCSMPPDKRLPGGRAIFRSYRSFQSQVPALLSQIELHESEVSFPDLLHLVQEWLRDTQIRSS